MRFVRGNLLHLDREVFIRDIVAAGYSAGEAKRQWARLQNDTIWVSTCGEYQVNEERVNSPLGEITHLSIKRMDKAPIRDWRVMQSIKNALCGPEREGCELYPAESRLLDVANQYHLWVLPEDSHFPFGYHQGRAVTDSAGLGETQRPLVVEESTPELSPTVWDSPNATLTTCTRCGKVLTDGRGGCEGAQHGNIGCAMNNPDGRGGSQSR